ncbi:hypothetical protein CC1G_04724 [Coprinopsis cinerea okayama7|uniref:Uncharacterized protein n=1 Tax=Coprinopsis cinerea (strain Okayama-7 / 130 / ATCC MYA-4618 / FGSC 9003) TaxID=240176 RepID=A8P2B8_COPC7|nr:hypothetical protein CC1G_04724 [Coprinopsis cinerea okayama7\|eukprot:XP_001838280.1 hypothetical protein CC1G_04724 [Coprinopsis cinerea okayama7\
MTNIEPGAHPIPGPQKPHVIPERQPSNAGAQSPYVPGVVFSLMIPEEAPSYPGVVFNGPVNIVGNPTIANGPATIYKDGAVHVSNTVGSVPTVPSAPATIYEQGAIHIEHRRDAIPVHDQKSETATTNEASRTIIQGAESTPAIAPGEPASEPRL